MTRYTIKVAFLTQDIVFKDDFKREKSICSGRVDYD